KVVIQASWNCTEEPRRSGHQPQSSVGKGAAVGQRSDDPRFRGTTQGQVQQPLERCAHRLHQLSQQVGQQKDGEEAGPPAPPVGTSFGEGRCNPVESYDGEQAPGEKYGHQGCEPRKEPVRHHGFRSEIGESNMGYMRPRTEHGPDQTGVPRGLTLVLKVVFAAGSGARANVPSDAKGKGRYRWNIAPPIGRKSRIRRPASSWSPGGRSCSATWRARSTRWMASAPMRISRWTAVRSTMASWNAPGTAPPTRSARAGSPVSPPSPRSRPSPCASMRRGTSSLPS